MQDEGEEKDDTAMSAVDCLSVCVGGICLSDGGDYMASGLLNRKAERAEFILNTDPGGQGGLGRY
jgi:hypothetical protein